MANKSIQNFIETFSDKRVLVIGDAMIDAYMWGVSERMSPEAPIPVIDVDKKEIRLGGAANVALNLKSLGVDPILLTLIGEDSKGKDFIELMHKDNLKIDGVITDSSRKTTQKTRIIASDKHVLRIDEEDLFDYSNTENVLDKIEKLHQKYNFDVVVFEDYNKGLLTHDIITSVIEFCKNSSIKTIVDPKKKNFLSYKGVDVFKPNLKEITEGLDQTCNPEKEEELNQICASLNSKLKADSIFLTLSEFGVYLYSENESYAHPSFERNIVDVSGAGDTVVSVASLALACDVNLSDLALISNLAGGLVCEHVGVIPIKKDLLVEQIRLIYDL